MDIILKIYEESLIKSNTENEVKWEIDNTDGLNIEKVEAGVLITPTEAALNAPHRVLECKIKKTKESIVYNLTIVHKNEGVDLPLPKRLKIFSNEEKIIPNSQLFLEGTWSFTDESYNSGFSLRKEGLVLTNIPVGFYTLQCEKDGKIESIEIQSREQTIANNYQQQVEQNDIQQAVVVSIAPSQNDELESLPEIKLPCKLQVIVSNLVKKEISIKKTESILIGRLSTTKNIVDLDLSSYTKNVKEISRNHLKIWYNEPYLFMKNVGSRKVLFKGMEMFPEDEAVLSKNCIINIADLVLKIVEG